MWAKYNDEGKVQGCGEGIMALVKEQGSGNLSTCFPYKLRRVQV